MLLKPGAMGSVSPEHIEQTSRTVLMAIDMVTYGVARQRWEQTRNQIDALVAAAESLLLHLNEHQQTTASVALRSATTITEATYNLKESGRFVEQSVVTEVDYGRAQGDLKILISAAIVLRDFVDERLDVEYAE